MSITLLRIVKAKTKSSKNSHHSSQQQPQRSSVSTIPGYSIFFDDPETCIRVSILNECFKCNESIFITVPAPYCYQLPAFRTNVTLWRLIDSLHRFELRTDKKSKRRLVRGVRETIRHLKLGHLKLLIVAIDIDIDTDNDHLQPAYDGWRALLRTAKETMIPVVFGMKRLEMSAALGCGPHIDTSVIGVLNADGAYQDYQELVEVGLKSSELWLETAAKIVSSELKAKNYSILRTLAYYGHYSVFQRLFDQNPELLSSIIDYPEEKFGNTLLMIAASLDEIAVLRLLLDYGADPLQKNFTLQTPLHLAASRGCVKSLKILLDRISDPSTAIKYKDASGLDPLQYAIISNNTESVSLLMKFCHEEEITDTIYFQSLTRTKSSCPEILVLLLLKGQLIFKDITDLIFSFAKSGNLECLRVFLAWLRKGRTSQDIADLVNAVPLYEERSAAWWAAYYGHVAVAKELIKHGAHQQFSTSVCGKQVSVGLLLDEWKKKAKTFCE